MEDENIIARVPGAYIAQAERKLPNPETATADEMESTVEVPGIGLVRVTCRRMSSKKGGMRHSFWTAERVVAIGHED